MIKGFVLGAVFVTGLLIGNQFFTQGKVYKTLETGTTQAISWIDSKIDINL